MAARLVLSSFSAVYHITYPRPVVTAPEAEDSQTLITNIRVWDGTSDRLTDTTSVLIVNNLIHSIGPDVGGGNATVIDGGGRTLMPGLIDSHVHLTHVYALGGVKGFEATTWEEIAANATAAAKEYLMNGFTTVRDMGGMADGIKRSIDRGLNDGPRIYAAGAYISQTVPRQHLWNRDSAGLKESFCSS